MSSRDWPHTHRIILGAVVGTLAGLAYIAIAAIISTPAAIPAALIGVTAATITTWQASRR